MLESFAQEPILQEVQVDAGLGLLLDGGEQAAFEVGVMGLYLAGERAPIGFAATLAKQHEKS
jgi:hypothetical protein